MFNFLYNHKLNIKKTNMIRYYNNRCNYKVISKIELNDFLKNIDNVILDVRTYQEYKLMHVKNSVNIPVNILEKNINKVVNEKNTKILVYCMSGNRTKKSIEILNRLGYNNICIFLNGGILPFKELNLLIK